MLQALFLPMRFHSYLNSATAIIKSYTGNVPFAVCIKKYFATQKKYGSTDRKQISNLCYDFYRLGKALPQLPVSEKIIVATFICSGKSNNFLHFHKPEWNEIIDLPVTEKLKIVGIELRDVFPWTDELSDGINVEDFTKSFFMQPNLFLRVRPGKMEAVVNKLKNTNITFDLLENDCISLPNTTKVDTLITLDQDAVVQDFNSQKVLNYLHTIKINQPLTTWDCCAASGGKSIQAYDILEGKVKLAVSDIRAGMLQNLANRFTNAGILDYKNFVADLSLTKNITPGISYDIVICDAPCSGSGTWSRTPEQLYYFNKKSIEEYANLQKSIVSNIIPSVKQQGLFFYITCSVFKKENEEIVNFIKQKFNLQLIQMETLIGYNNRADTMFSAVFKNQ